MKFPEPDGRWLIGLLALALLLHTAYAIGQGPAGYDRAWHRLGTFSIMPPFLDLRCLLGAVQTEAAGGDPLLANPYDPYNRPILYPRIWIPLAALFHPRVSPIDLGYGLAVAFLGVLLLTLPPLSPAEGAILAPLLFSPPLFLAVERGNNDLLVLAVVGLALLSLRLSWPFRAAGYLLVLAAALLKFYPLAAALTALKEGSRRALAVLLLAGAVFGAYAWAIRDDIAQIQRGIFPGIAHSYGAATAALYLAQQGVPAAGGKGWTLLAGALPLIPLLALSWWLARRGAGAAETLDGPRRDGLMAGAALFLATFMMGSNYEYRMLVLFPALPGVVRLALGTGAAAVLSRAALALLLPFLWLSAATVWFFDLKVSWVDLLRSGIGYLVAGYFAWALLASLPPWAGRWLGVTFDRKV